MALCLVQLHLSLVICVYKRLEHIIKEASMRMITQCSVSAFTIVLIIAVVVWRVMVRCVRGHTLPPILLLVAYGLVNFPSHGGL